MDGSPQVVRFDATTLWHLDAAKWAPSTASKAAKMIATTRRPMSASPQKRTNRRKSRLVCFVPTADISEVLRADAYHSDRSTLLAQQLHHRKMMRRALWPKELASDQPIYEWSEPLLAQGSLGALSPQA